MAVSLDATKEIFKAFMSHPSRAMYIKEIEQKVDLSYERVQHYLNELKKEGILAGKTKGRIKEYVINKNHELVPKIFGILEMERRQEFAKRNPQAFGQIHEFIKKMLANKLFIRLQNKMFTRFIILFGSTARGEAKGGSDIDLLVVIEHKKGDSRLLDVTDFNEKHNSNLSVQIITIDELRKRWKTEPVYLNIWNEKIVVAGEENFWGEVLDMGEPA